MSLRNQPYFPLYVQDYLTDEKLNECSAQSQGVYIKILCLMHKSNKYGTILLKQKDKQSSKQINNFALKIVKHLTFCEKILIKSIEELIEEEVLFIDGDKLCQKRMIKDNDISIKRSNAGRKGGKSTQYKASFALAKDEANSEDVNKDISIDVINNKKEEILNSVLWIEQICIKKKVELDFVNDYLNIFLDDLELKDDLHKGESEIKKHFINWFNLNLKELKKETNGNRKNRRERFIGTYKG